MLGEDRRKKNQEIKTQQPHAYISTIEERGGAKRLKRNVMQLPDSKGCFLEQDADTPDAPGLQSCQNASKQKGGGKNHRSKGKGWCQLGFI